MMEVNEIKKNILICLLFSIFALLFTGCEKDMGENKVFRYDIKNGTSSIDPQFSTSPTSKMIIKNTFEGLFGYDENGKIKKVLVKDYTISQDNLVYIFNLYDNRQWSNEDYVTANDFEYAFKRMFDSEALSPFANNYISIKNAQEILNNQLSNDFLGITAIDKSTLKVELEQPNPYFLSLLTLNAAMPCNENFLIAAKGKYGLDVKSVLANGPFYVKNWDNKSTITLRRNQYYNSSDAVIATGINYYVGRENTFDLFAREKSDCIFIDKSEIDTVRKMKGSVIPFESTTWLLSFNQQSTAFDNENIRLAFASSIEFENNREFEDEHYKIAKNIIPSSANVMSGSYREKAGDLTYTYLSSLNAKEKLSLGLEETGLKKMSKTTLLLPDNEMGKVVAQELQKVWAKNISVFINFKLVPIDELTKLIKNKDYQIALIPITPDNDSPINSLIQFTTDNSENYFGADNEEFNKIVYDATHSGNEETSVALIKTAEQMLIDKAFVIPIFSSNKYFAMAEGVSDIEVSIFDENCFFKYAKRID
ncbi:MAG: peptide ABC transporter substrate-binding protein [Oscillospiraceae bacterium]